MSVIDWKATEQRTETAYYRWWGAVQLYHRGHPSGWIWHWRPARNEGDGYQDVTLCGIELDMSEGGKTFAATIPQTGDREWKRSCRQCRIVRRCMAAEQGAGEGSQ